MCNILLSKKHATSNLLQTLNIKVFHGIYVLCAQTESGLYHTFYYFLTVITICDVDLQIVILKF